MNLLSTILPFIQIGLAAILITLILIQQSDAGLGAAFGGGDASGSFRKKRGLEKTLFRSTIVIAVLFVAAAALNLFI